MPTNDCAAAGYFGSQCTCWDLRDSSGKAPEPEQWCTRCLKLISDLYQRRMGIPSDPKQVRALTRQVLILKEFAVKVGTMEAHKVIERVDEVAANALDER